MQIPKLKGPGVPLTFVRTMHCYEWYIYYIRTLHILFINVFIIFIH